MGHIWYPFFTLFMRNSKFVMFWLVEAAQVIGSPELTRFWLAEAARMIGSPELTLFWLAEAARMIGSPELTLYCLCDFVSVCSNKCEEQSAGCFTTAASPCNGGLWNTGQLLRAFHMHRLLNIFFCLHLIIVRLLHRPVIYYVRYALV